MHHRVRLPLSLAGGVLVSEGVRCGLRSLGLLHDTKRVGRGSLRCLRVLMILVEAHARLVLVI